MLRTSWQFVDTDPKNQAVITPCFRINGVGPYDPQQLCTDLAVAMATWTVPGSKLITVKAYDLQGTKPVYPTGSATSGNATPTPITSGPQQAVCFSFFSDVNQPRRRGRLYIPPWAASTTGADLGAATVSATLRAKVGVLATTFSALGGANVDWIVWSRADNAAHQINNWFITDSWAIQRRRKLKASARSTGTVSG